MGQGLGQGLGQIDDPLVTPVGVSSSVSTWEDLIGVGTEVDEPGVAHPRRPRSVPDDLSTRPDERPDISVTPDDLADLADLDHPRLVISEGYVGPERRGPGFGGWIRRTGFGWRRSLSRLEVLVVAAVAVLVVAAVMMVGTAPKSAATRAHRSTAPAAALSAPTAGGRDGTDARAAAPATVAARPHVNTGRVTTPTTAAAPAATPAPSQSTSAAAGNGAGTAAGTGTTQPATGTTQPVATSTTVPATTSTTASLTPAQMGAEALTLVRYPWQKIPGYTIRFLPISDAPSPGFYGNTTFTWGQVGGTSDLYVYPGETVQRLAAITAFEIGHEVDAAALYTAGEQQIENILGIHPASWAPDCDCAEQGFLSGWYAAAFSNYWSPGVGQWATIAPEPSGAVLAAVEPYLDPAIPGA